MFGLTPFPLLAAGIVIISFLIGALIQKIADYERPAKPPQEE